MKYWTYSLFFPLVCLVANVQAESSFAPTSKQENVWSERSYRGPIDVHLEISNGLSARIETQDLILCSMNWDHFANYVELFGDPETMKKFATGIPIPAEAVERRMRNWINRWQQYCDPFSPFAIFLKGEGCPFIGHVILGYGSREGEAELAYIIRREYQNQGYGKQAVTAILYGWAPRLIRDQYWVNMRNDDCAPGPLKVIHATARNDNPYSIRILDGVGMKSGEPEWLMGALRTHYQITVDELLDRKISRVP